MYGASSRKPFPNEVAFKVKGIEGPPRIPIALLTTIYIAACGLLWLDKLSIRQDESEDDKKGRAWRVEHLFKIYSSFYTCRVMPRDFGQLMAIDEKPTWLERSWRL